MVVTLGGGCVTGEGEPGGPGGAAGGKGDWVGESGIACSELGWGELRPRSESLLDHGGPYWPVEGREPVAIRVHSTEDPEWGGLYLVDPLEGRVAFAYEGPAWAADEAYVLLARELGRRYAPSAPVTDVLFDAVRGQVGIKVRLPPPPPPPVPGGQEPDVFGAWLVEQARAISQSADHGGGDPAHTEVFEGDEIYDLPATESLWDWSFGTPFHAGFEVRQPVILMITSLEAEDQLDVLVVDPDGRRVVRHLTGRASEHARAVAISAGKSLLETDAGFDLDLWAVYEQILVGVKVRTPPPPPPPVPGGGERIGWGKWAVQQGVRAAAASRACAL